MESSVGRGRRGESLAQGWLEDRGWTVLDRNWRDGPRELDLVVRKDEVLAFVEVKARSSDEWGGALGAIGWRKRREIERAARAWIRLRAADLTGVKTLRFDAVGVQWGPDSAEITHVMGAWRVGE